MPAPTIDELLLADDGERWTKLGFTISDGCCELGEVRLRFLADASARGIVGWSLRDLAGVELDGLPTTISKQPPPRAAPTHPNGVVAIDHIVAFSPSLDRSIHALEGAGLDLRRIREQPTPAGAPRQAFFRLGADILELVQEPHDVVRRTGGHDRPARFWGLAVRVANLEQTVKLLAAHAGPIRPAIQTGRRISTVRRTAGLAVPLALMSAPAER
jgi:hypothetical protein